jgi:hypothetical protein
MTIQVVLAEKSLRGPGRRVACPNPRHASCSSPLVPMVEASHLRELDDLPQLRPLDSPRLGASPTSDRWQRVSGDADHLPAKAITRVDQEGEGRLDEGAEDGEVDLPSGVTPGTGDRHGRYAHPAPPLRTPVTVGPAVHDRRPAAAKALAVRTVYTIARAEPSAGPGERPARLA